METIETDFKIKKIFTIREIMKIYPHRFPMLFVDRIELTEENTAIGYKNVSIDEIWFQGHFPEFPILPGIIIVEPLSQVGGMCFHEDYLVEEKPGIRIIPFMAGYEKVRFHEKVFPGDSLRFIVKRDVKYGNIARVKGVVTNQRNKKVAEGQVTYSFEEVSL